MLFIKLINCLNEHMNSQPGLQSGGHKREVRGRKIEDLFSHKSNLKVSFWMSNRVQEEQPN